MSKVHKIAGVFYHSSYKKGVNYDDIDEVTIHINRKN